MSSVERKLARKKMKAAKKFEKQIKKQVSLFDKIPDHCLTCDKDYDKKDKEQVTSWRVIVRNDRVNLYCPECWNTATKIVKEEQ